MRQMFQKVALFVRDGISMPNGAPLSKVQEQLKAAYEGLFKAKMLWKRTTH